MKITRQKVYGWFYALAAKKSGRADNARYLISVNLIALLFPVPIWLASTVPNAAFLPVLVASVGLFMWGAVVSVNRMFAVYPLPEAAPYLDSGYARIQQALPAGVITIGCIAGGLYGFYALATLQA